MIKEDKKVVLSITSKMIASEVPKEFEIFELFRGSILEELMTGDSDEIAEHSHFGGQESILSYYILGIVAWVSTTLANEGIKIAKITMYEWIKENKEKIMSKYNSKNHIYALEIIERYLEKEVNGK